MSNKTKTHETAHTPSPNYHPYGANAVKPESTLSRWMDRMRDLGGNLREKKLGRKALVTLAATGALFGVERAISASTDDARAEVAQVNAKFEPVIKPAAERIAKDAIDKYTQSQAEKWPDSKGNGYIVKDAEDPAKFDIAFNGHLQDGSEFKITATVGGDANGKPDPSKVDHAEIHKTTSDDLQTSVITLDFDRDAVNGGSYWTASSALANKGMKTMGYSSHYSNPHYEDLDKKLAAAKEITEDVSKQLGDVEQPVDK